MNQRHFHHSVTRISRPTGTPEDAWDLFCAAAEGHLPTMRRLIDHDPELMHYQIWYEFPIHFAARAGHADAVALLLEAGTNPAWSYFGYSSWQKLLPIAERRGDENVREILVTEMKRRFSFDPAHQALFAAMRDARDVAEVANIINEHSELIHIADEFGNRLLHWAAMARRLPVIEMLLDAGADIQARRADLQTPLHLSMLGGDYWFRKSDHCDPTTTAESVTDLLLERGAKYEFSVAVARGDRRRVDQLLSDVPTAATRLNESRRSPLGIAALKGQVEMVRLLLERGANPNLPEECCPRGAALFKACGHNDVEMVKLLLEYGADPNAESDSSGCCLTIAEHRKTEETPEIHRLLREHGAVEPLWELEKPEQIRERMRLDKSISTDDCYWGGILQRVLAVGNIAVLREFFDRFGDEPIRTMDPANGWNLVHNPELLDELIRHGMNINRPDWYGQTYLHICAAKDNGTTVAERYLDRGIDVHAVDFVNGTTALGVAAMRGHTAMVKFLLERGADARVPADPTWAQPRVLAEREEKWDAELAIRTHIVLQQLAEDPASVITRDSNTLHSAAHYSEEEIVWALLEAGADIEAEHSTSGGKPLHWATEGNVKICRWLIDRGADVNSRVVSNNERNGMTPLIYCAWWCGDDEECIKIAELLIDSGADVTARDAEDKSAVQRARQQGHNNLAEALKGRGCE